MIREMKDSGIEWIGDIPQNWKIKRIKFCYRIITGNGFPLELQGNSDGDYPICKASDISVAKKILVSAANYLSSEIVLTQHFNIIPKGSILHAKIGEAMKKNNRTLCEVDCCVDNNCQGLVPIMNNSNYSYYLFLCIDMQWFDNAGTIPCVNNQKLRDSKIPCPVEAEQQSISNYLDKKCEEIDSLSADIQTQISILEEYKKSIITEAVTKGLNPDVEMKDSGIEWVEEVPIDWKITRFKYVGIVKSNLVNVNLYQDYPQISPDNIAKDSGILLGYNTVEEAGVISDNHLFYKGQILYSKIRPKLNKATIAPFDGLCSADMYPIETNECSEFVLYMILSQYFLKQVVLVTEDRVKMPKINQEELSGIRVILPAREVQEDIAKHLDSICSEIDGVIKDKQRQLEVLEQYKKSLIYEYVTGKKEVMEND